MCGPLLVQEGMTIVENRTADIIQETRKLQLRKKGGLSEAQNQSSSNYNVRQHPQMQTRMQPQMETDLEIQLKASRDVRLQLCITVIMKFSCICGSPFFLFYLVSLIEV